MDISISTLVANKTARGPVSSGCGGGGPNPGIAPTQALRKRPEEGGRRSGGVHDQLAQGGVRPPITWVVLPGDSINSQGALFYRGMAQFPS